MELSKDVFYRCYGDAVYLRHTGLRRDILLNASAYQALELLKAAGAGTREQLLEALTAGGAGTKAGCERFLDSLLAEGILTDGEMDAQTDGMTVSESVKELCAQRHLLYSACFELTYRCNERCVHCYIDDAPPDAGQELTLDEYKSLIDQLREMGCMFLLLTGGEVFLKKDFLEIAEYAAGAGLAVDIYTNGSLMTDSQFDRLRALPLNSLSFSLYGGTARVHDAITGFPGSFERTVRAAMMTNCAGIDTYIKTVVMRENAEDLENLCRLCQRLNIPLNASFEITDSHTGASAEEHRLEDVEAYVRALGVVDRFFPFARCPERRDPERPVCNAGRFSLSVDPYGRVKPCISIQTVLGDVRRQSMRDIWEHAPMDWLTGLRFGDVCPSSGSCAFSGRCGMCLGSTGVSPNRPPVRPAYPCVLAEAHTILEKDKYSVP